MALHNKTSHEKNFAIVTCAGTDAETVFIDKYGQCICVQSEGLYMHCFFMNGDCI